jgi:hypothetical protein
MKNTAPKKNKCTGTDKNIPVPVENKIQYTGTGSKKMERKKC